MERLLSDAEKISGIHYDIGNYADVVDAIHVMQDSMGITGTTAKEASTTIQGSISSMKAAWTNFLTGMADPDQDFNALVGNLVDSVVTVADNLIPRIQALLPRLVDGISQVIQKLAQYLPKILKELLPSLIQGVTGLLTALVGMLPQLLQIIIQILPDLIQAIVQIFQAIVKELPKLIQMLADALPETLPILVDGAVQLVAALVIQLPQIIMALIKAIPAIIASIVKSFGPLGNGLVTVAKAGVEGVTKKFHEMSTKVGPIVKKLGDSIATHFNAAKEKAGNAIEKIGNKFGPTFSKAQETVRKAINKIKDFFNFDWHLPKLKMPHFNMKGKFSLDPPSVPHIGVDWYKKAMDQPKILTEPTVFGMNPSTGNYRAGGEAGDEVVAGKNTLLNLIREVVSTENNRNTDDIVDAIMNGMANLALQIDVYLGGRKIYDKLTKGVIKKVTREQDDKFGAKGVHA